MEPLPETTGQVSSKSWLFIVGTFVWAFIVVATVIGEMLPASSAPMRFLGSLAISDKVFHFSAYALIAFFPSVLFSRRAALLCAGVAVLLGIALEFGQELLPDRSFEIADMAANTLGVLSGLTVGTLVRTRRRAEL